MGKINWFVGHMHKSMQQIASEIKSCDLILNILDARSIKSSMNDELIKLANNKPIINIALKSDLADLSHKDSNVLYCDINQKNLVNLIKNKINTTLDEKIKKLQAKGLINPHFYLMILGLPNIGKSSLINKLVKKNKLVVENRPGVTRNLNAVKIDKYYSIYDTPGIMVKKINDDKTGYILGTLGCIDSKVLPLHEVIKFNTDFYFDNYHDEICKYFAYNEVYDYYNFITFICNKYKFINRNNILDTSRAEQFLFKLYQENKIVKVNYDK